MEEKFRRTWREITQAIFTQHGSLGSRLHQSEDGTFIAYAQWPDAKRWEHHNETLGIELARKEQLECLIGEPVILNKLTVTDDLLKSPRSQPIHQEAHANDER